MNSLKIQWIIHKKTLISFKLSIHFNKKIKKRYFCFHKISKNIRKKKWIWNNETVVGEKKTVAYNTNLDLCAELQFSSNSSKWCNHCVNLISLKINYFTHNPFIFNAWFGTKNLKVTVKINIGVCISLTMFSLFSDRSILEW